MDFDKFISLLDKKSLYFARADKLGDPFEGSFTKFNYDRMREGLTEENKKLLSLIYNKIRYLTFINCWHLNENESAAMWKLYLKSDNGIAIQSTCAKLKNGLITDSDFYIGNVNYIDFDKEAFRSKSPISQFINKRKSYEHENEIRVIISDFLKNGAILDPINPDKIESGKYIPVNIEELIEKIYVSPNSQKWFFELVKSIIEKYQFDNDRVKISNLSDSPLF